MNAEGDFYRHLAQTSEAPLGLQIVDARGVYVYDVRGRSILDAISGVCVSAVGHRHPKVVAAIEEQVSCYQHVMVYGECVLSPQTRLAVALSDTLPEPLSVSYFTNSGSEATEGALKLARRYTGRSDFVAFKGCYHGSSYGALSLIGHESWRRAYRPLLPGVAHLPFGDEASLSAINQKTAAVIIEPIQGEAGVRIPTAAYLQAVSERCKATGALLILDEIQTGWGRTGTFWALERFGLRPDVLLSAKALGGGLPLGVFVSSREIMQCLSHNPPLGHISTFGGHPLSCAASLASLAVIEEEGLHLAAEAKGRYLRDRLAHPSFLEIRQQGLMIALQLESTEVARKVIASALQVGLLIDSFLFCESALRISPPLIITESDMDKLASLVNESVKKAGI